MFVVGNGLEELKIDYLRRPISNTGVNEAEWQPISIVVKPATQGGQPHQVGAVCRTSCQPQKQRPGERVDKGGFKALICEAAMQGYLRFLLQSDPLGGGRAAVGPAFADKGGSSERQWVGDFIDPAGLLDLDITRWIVDLVNHC